MKFIKSLFFILMSFSIISFSWSQSSSKNFFSKNKSIDQIYSLVRTNGDGTQQCISYQFKKQQDAEIVEQLKDGSITKSKIEIPFDDILNGHLFWNGDILVGVFVRNNREKKNFELSVVAYDETYRIDETKLVESIIYDWRDENAGLYFQFSPDGSKILILSYVDGDERKDPFGIEAIVLDAELQKLNEFMLVESELKSQKLNQLMDVKLSSSGEVFLLLKKYRKKQKECRLENFRQKVNYTYTVFSYPLGESNEMEELDTENYFIHSARIYLNRNEEPSIVTACYQTYKENARCVGFINFVRNKRTKRIEKKRNVFSNEELFELHWNKKSNAQNFLLKEQIVIDDLIYFFFEQNYLSRAMSFHWNIRSFINHHGVVFTMNDKGEIIDHQCVPKFDPNNKGILSSIFIKVDNKWALVYQDRKKNLEFDIHDEYVKFGPSLNYGDRAIVIAYVDENEMLIRKQIEVENSWSLNANQYSFDSKGRLNCLLYKEELAKYNFKILEITPLNFMEQ